MVKAKRVKRTLKRKANKNEFVGGAKDEKKCSSYNTIEKIMETTNDIYNCISEALEKRYGKKGGGNDNDGNYGNGDNNAPPLPPKEKKPMTPTTEEGKEGIYSTLPSSNSGNTPVAVNNQRYTVMDTGSDPSNNEEPYGAVSPENPLNPSNGNGSQEEPLYNTLNTTPKSTEPTTYSEYNGTTNPHSPENNEPLYAELQTTLSLMSKDKLTKMQNLFNNLIKNLREYETKTKKRLSKEENKTKKKPTVPKRLRKIFNKRGETSA
jgi:hypothetical protein